MSARVAIVMAGGAGTRFWPLSRRAQPKQLLPLGTGRSANESLIAACVRRLGPIIDHEHVLVVTTEPLVSETARHLPQVPEANILGEPVGRNTAACVGWALLHIGQKNPDAVVAVVPADAHIGDEPAYVAALTTALDIASQGSIVTIGIEPTRAETGYGYIESGLSFDHDAPGRAFRVKRFVEKPDRAAAEQFLASGKHLWNSGMFFFQAKVMLEAIRTHLPELGKGLAEIEAAMRQGRTQEQQALGRIYPTLPAVSIDHGVMEKVSDIVVVPGAFGWSDLGSWTAAWELARRDARDNAVTESTVCVDAKGCYVHAPAGKRVALVGVQDLIVVDTEDALLVIPRERAQDVRLAVDELKKRGDEEVL